MAQTDDTKPLDVHTTVRIPATTHDEIKALAEREYRTVSAEVRRLIERGLEQERDAA